MIETVYNNILEKYKTKERLEKIYFLQKIEYLPNDLVKPNGKSIDDIRVADIVLKAYFENGEILFIDIEIQTNFHKKIFKRWVENTN